MTATDESKTVEDGTSTERTFEIQAEDPCIDVDMCFGISNLFDESAVKSSIFKCNSENKITAQTIESDYAINDITDLFENDNNYDYLFNDECGFDEGDIDNLFSQSVQGSSIENCGLSKNETRQSKPFGNSQSESDSDLHLIPNDDSGSLRNKPRQIASPLKATSLRQKTKKVSQKSKAYAKGETKSKVEKKISTLNQYDFYDSELISRINTHIMGSSRLENSQYVSDSARLERLEDDTCRICLDSHVEPKVLPLCSHKFCGDCIDQHFKIKPVCPVCFTSYGVITGNQPVGTMNHHIEKVQLPGYESYDTIAIDYGFPSGIQTNEHPNPGYSYDGTSRRAYLPNSPEGQKVLRLLKEAFRRRLTFTVGRSRTTGADNVVTWNDIHHKTSTCGGMPSFGYPDPTYLSRVQEELAAVGVTEKSLNEIDKFK